ncbi:MAG: hypothetical protein ABIR18_11520 [Chitinophagaceae bacterium]
MKKIYPFLFISFILFSCSKDAFKSYEHRIEGSWRLTDVDRRGFGGSISHLPFTDGEFTFNQGGTLIYTSNTGVVYQGSWDIDRRTVSNGCQTDDNGNQTCDDQLIRSLHVTAIDFTAGDVKSEHFEEIVFTGGNKFKAYIRNGLHTYLFHFRRN